MNLQTNDIHALARAISRVVRSRGYCQKSLLVLVDMIIAFYEWDKPSSKYMLFRFKNDILEYIFSPDVDFSYDFVISCTQIDCFTLKSINYD